MIDDEANSLKVCLNMFTNSQNNRVRYKYVAEI